MARHLLARRRRVRAERQGTHLAYGAVMKSGLLTAVFLTSFAACRPVADDTSPGAVLAPDSPSCLRPLAALCKSRCLTYDESVRALEESAASRFGGCTVTLGSLRAGVCGDLRYTALGHAYGGTTFYYDSTGTAVAGRVQDDVYSSDCDDPPYGFVPTCQPEVTRDLCAERRGLPSL
jgi:hypothetical protein